MKQKALTVFTLSFVLLGLVLGFTSMSNPDNKNPLNRERKENLRNNSSALNTQTQSVQKNQSVFQSDAAPYYTDNFDGANDTNALKSRGYLVYFRGTDIQAYDTWYQGDATAFTAFNGPDTGYVAADYTTLEDFGDIDNWLVLPKKNVAAGDIISFYARGYSTTFVDSIRVMYSAAGDSVPEAGSWVELGRFQALVGSWENKSFAAATAGANGRFAIRYATVDGGPAGKNTFYIGIDALTLSPSPFTFANDMKANAFVTPLNGGTVGIGVAFGVQASFQNVGINAQTNVPVRYKILNASNVVVYNNTGVIPSISSGGFATVTFANATLASAGTYTIQAISELVGDQDPSNNQINGTISTAGALTGDYTIGLPLFNSLTGKNITMSKVVKKVVKDVYEPYNNDAATKDENANITETGYANGRLVTREVEEITWVPMENGVEYKGSLFVAGSDNSSGHYGTLTAAVGDLNVVGASGPVRFILTDATYPNETFPITINSYPGISATNKLTILPNTGVNATITGSLSGALIRVLASYVTIDGSNNGSSSRNLTIENTAGSGPTCLTIASSGVTPITNVTLKNCNIINSVGASGVVVSDAATLGSAGYFNNITISNNSVQRSYIGIYSIAVVSAGNGSGLNVSSNNLDVAGANANTFVGIYLQGIDGGTVSSNNIGNFDGAGNQDDRGIFFATGTKNSVIEKNKVHDLIYTGTSGYGGHGAFIASGVTNCNITVKNNMIWGLKGDGWNYSSIPLDNVIGIATSSTQTGLNIYFNSINLFGNTLNQTNSMSMCIYLATGTVADIRDNILVNNLGLLAAIGRGSCGIYAQTNNAQFTALNYNDYVINPTGSGAKYFGQIAATGQTTFAAWKTATTRDANSINADPLFISNNDLHISSASSPVVNAGISIAGVTTDIDGQTRSATPTIGADEVTSSLSLKFNFEACPSPSAVTVELRSSVSPYNLVQSVSGVAGGNVASNIGFSSAANGVPYYVVVKSVNMVETWSATTVTFTSGTANYDFTTNLNKAYGSNQVLSGGIPSVYQGDANQDGFVDAFDLGIVYNDVNQFVTSPQTDFDCNGITDLTDILVAFNNGKAFIQVQKP